LGWLSWHSDRLWIGRPWFQSCPCKILFAIVYKPALGPTQPSIQWVLWVLAPGIMQHELEADWSPSSNAEVKNVGAILSLPQVFML
jgi:hypothetical protein